MISKAHLNSSPTFFLFETVRSRYRALWKTGDDAAALKNDLRKQNLRLLIEQARRPIFFRP